MIRHSVETEIPPRGGPVRLRSIDALRGAAALAVVLYHTAGQARPAESGAAWADAVAGWLGAAARGASAFGYVGVFLFFVISGFCIHLGYARARAAGQDARPAFLPFWRRRVRRLYPPYLVALSLSLAVAFVTVGLPWTRLFAWDVASHLLMLHNFDPRTCYGISSVFWTLAVEEQLYLAYFPLLALRRRWGWTATLLCCFAARVAWLVFAELLRGATGFGVPVAEAAAAHWFTWALGALAVESAFGLVALPRWSRDLRVGAAALLAAALLAQLQDAQLSSRLLHDAAWLLLHPAWGLGFFVLLNRAVAAERGWRDARQARDVKEAQDAREVRDAGDAREVRDTRDVREVKDVRDVRDAPRAVAALAAAGIISYSLYLIHPLVLLETWRAELLLAPLPPLAVSLFVMTPLCLACAWAFYRLFERPFLARTSLTAPRARRAAAAHAIVPPAALTPEHAAQDSAVVS